MTGALRCLAAALVVLGALLPGPAPAATTPQPPLASDWGMPLEQLSGLAAGRGLVFALTNPPAGDNCDSLLTATRARRGTELWRRVVLKGRCGIGRPRYGGARVFVNADGATAAYEADTGVELWRHDFGAGLPDWHIRMPDHRLPVTRDLVYVAVDDAYASREFIVALSTATGEERWRREIDLGFDAEPMAVVGDVLYVATECTLTALDRRTGAERWSRSDACGSPPLSTGGEAVVQVAGDYLAIWWGHDEGVVVRRSDGAPVRRFASRAPAIPAAGGLLLTRDREGIIAEALLSGARKWRYTGEPPFVPPWAHEVRGRPLPIGQTVYVSDEEEHLHALDLATGALRWRAALPLTPAPPEFAFEEPISDLLVTEDRLFAATEHRLLAFAPGTPDAEILTGPPRTSVSDRARFTFTTPPGQTSTCELDFGDWVPCRSPHVVRVLGPGPHTLRVRHTRGPAYRPAMAPSPAWRWTVAQAPKPPLPRVHGPYPSWDDTELVSRPTGTGMYPGDGANPSSSCTGRYVAFSADAALVPGNEAANHNSEVFVRDLAARATSVASIGVTGTRTGDGGWAGSPAISGDGRMVAFTSNDPEFSTENPDDGDWTVAQLYVRDMVTQKTQLVSRATGPAGAAVTEAAQSPAISADGRYVAFVTATPLDPADDNGGPGREGLSVYVRDLLTQTTTLIGSGAHPSFSADGSRIAYSRFYPENGRPAGVYLYNQITGKRTLVEGAADGFYATRPTISADGTRVAFHAGVTDASAPRVVVRDLRTGARTVASRADGAWGRLALGASSEARISGDGEKVVFWSDDPQLDPVHGLRTIEDVYFWGAVYVRDLAAGTTRVVNVAAGTHGLPAPDQLDTLAISGDGTSVAFRSDSEVISHEPNDIGVYRLYARGIDDRTPPTRRSAASPTPARRSTRTRRRQRWPAPCRRPKPSTRSSGSPPTRPSPPSSAGSTPAAGGPAPLATTCTGWKPSPTGSKPAQPTGRATSTRRRS